MFFLLDLKLSPEDGIRYHGLIWNYNVWILEHFQDSQLSPVVFQILDKYLLNLEEYPLHNLHLDYLTK